MPSIRIFIEKARKRVQQGRRKVCSATRSCSSSFRIRGQSPGPQWRVRPPGISPKCPILMRRIQGSKCTDVRSQCAGFRQNCEIGSIQNATVGPCRHPGSIHCAPNPGVASEFRQLRPPPTPHERAKHPLEHQWRPTVGDLRGSSPPRFDP